MDKLFGLSRVLLEGNREEGMEGGSLREGAENVSHSLPSLIPCHFRLSPPFLSPFPCSPFSSASLLFS